MHVTYFAPADPRPPSTLSDQEYAAAHCRQTAPTATLDLDLAALEAACRGAARAGRKGDAGYIIAGACATTRREGGPAGFALIDQDEGALEPDWAALDCFQGFAWTTASHRPDRPSWRVVIPFTEPAAHGQLRCPFKGGFIRNRTQPAFLPTHPIDPAAVQWRRLAGTQRLDPRDLGASDARAYDPDASRQDSLLGAAFAVAGMVLGEQTGGLRVRCPWVDRHSDQQDGGTAVFHSDPDNRGFGKFHCSRTECAKAAPTSWDALEALKAGPARDAVLNELRHWPDPGLNGYRRVDPAPTPASTEQDTIHGAFQLSGGAPPPGPLEVPEGQRATPETWGETMNRRHVVLTCVGGKCRVLSWTVNELGWRTHVLSSLPDFRARYEPRTILVEGAKKPVSIGDWWLSWRGRAEAESLTFRPDRPSEAMVDGRLNLWRGYGVTPAPGKWDHMQELIRDVVANGNREHWRYIVRWLAWALQHPGERAGVVLVLRGRKGTGKNTLLDALCRLMGQHAKTVSNSRHLVGNFNAHLADCALLFANEAIAASDKTSESVLKTLVTDDTMPIERKGVDVEMWPNRLTLCMASNEDWCVPAGLDERRFAVFDVSAARMQDHAFFGRLHAELQSGGYEAMLHDLLAHDLQDWHPRQGVPKTTALVDNQLDGLRGPDRLVHQMLDQGWVRGGSLKFTIAGVDVEPGSVFVSTVGLVDGDARTLVAAGKALARCIRLPGGTKPISMLATVKRGFATQRLRGFVLPPLAKARANWSESTGLSPQWADAGVEQWTTDEVE